ncbi:MAG: hypothetical protein AAF204_05300, partial [Pseudomonadota bacterium]
DTYYGYLFDLLPDGRFVYHGFGPVWKYKDNIPEYCGEVFVSNQVRKFYAKMEHVTPGGFIFHRASIALQRIGPYLAAINEPQSTLHIDIPPSKLQEKRRKKGRVAFFDYYEVEINRPKDESGVEIKGNSIQGRKGVALHMVRGHERQLHGGNKTWIKSHKRGNAKYGVVHKSFRKLENDEPQ